MEAPVHLTSPRSVRQLLQALEFTPSKSLGQNFLVDANIRDRILDASGTQPGDHVLEVGPGLGVMTEGLLARGARVTAIELDKRLAHHLHTYFGERDDLVLRQEDATHAPWARLFAERPVRVVSNLPYSVGSRLLFDWADPAWAPDSITVMVQDDVAQRLTAPTGSDAYGLLAIQLAIAFHGRIVHQVSGSCFLPPPRVGSAVVHLVRRARPLWNVQDWSAFQALSKFAFSRRRKQMGTIFRSAPPALRRDADQLRRCGIEPDARPEEVAPENWAQLGNEPAAIFPTPSA